MLRGYQHAIDAKKGLLFAACHNQKLIVLDSHTGKVVSTLPIGKNVDGCASDPERELVFTSNGEGTLTVVSDRDAAHPAVVATVPTRAGARTVDLDPTTHLLYLPTAQSTPASQPGGRPSLIPHSFTILVVGQ
jgi:hypothetical protein